MVLVKKFYILIACICALILKILDLHLNYPYQFDKKDHFLGNIHIPNENDPWTTWSKKELEIAKKGREFALKTNIVVSGLLRNASKNMLFVKKKLQILSSLFGNIHVILMENDSHDNTRKTLLNWARESPFKNITFECVHPETFAINEPECKVRDYRNNNIRDGCFAGRIERMTFLRNQLHEYTCAWLEKNPSFEFVLYADLDLRGIFFKRGICHTFGKFMFRPHIQVIGFRGTTSKGWLWDPYAFESIHTKSNFGQFITCRISTRQINFSQGLVRVSCSFSGGTFIRARDFKPEYKFKCEFALNNMFAICEHIPFYRNFKYMFINTYMVQTHTK
jgi:hypothetical protein